MEVDGGLTCLKCGSMLFSIYELVEHLKECNGGYFKHGDCELVMNCKLMVEVGEE